MRQHMPVTLPTVACAICGHRWRPDDRLLIRPVYPFLNPHDPLGTVYASESPVCACHRLVYLPELPLLYERPTESEATP